MINNVSLTGRIVKEINVFENDNNKVGSFTLVVQRSHKNKNDEFESDFIRIVAFNKTAETIEKYTTKGSLIGVEGKVQKSNYENKEGQKVYSTEIVANRIIFLETKEQFEQRIKNNKKEFKNDDTNENSYPTIEDKDLPF